MRKPPEKLETTPKGRDNPWGIIKYLTRFGSYETTVYPPAIRAGTEERAGFNFTVLSVLALKIGTGDSILSLATVLRGLTPAIVVDTPWLKTLSGPFSG